MKLAISFSSPALPDAGTLVLFCFEGRVLSASAATANERTGGALRRAIDSGRFTGAKDQVLDVVAPAGMSVARIVLVGLGKAAEVDALAVEYAAGRLVAHLANSGERVLSVAVDPLDGAALDAAGFTAHFAAGAQLRAYAFDRYRTRQKEEEKPSLERLVLLCADPAAAEAAHARLAPVAESVGFARDLVNEPANILYPVEFARRAQETLSGLGVEVEVLGRKALDEIGMRLLIAVAQGSIREPQVVVMRWNGGGDAAPVALVGKGVCFDSGGISLKPAAGMDEMKMDMGGAAAVVGTMRTLAARNAKANVVGIIGLVENMPGGEAQRPGDIVRSLAGQTVEVLNTDAEGRLVLADCLAYVQDRFKPRAIVDLATLTGAIIISLGHEYAGLFSNDDGLSGQLTAPGKVVGEEVRRLPMGEVYDKKLKSKWADIANISGGRDAGSITAAQFLRRFVNNGTPWAHLDIAGTAWIGEDKPTVPRGGTGFGVRLLDQLIAANYEAS
jgi:leucyl aminopeptidase